MAFRQLSFDFASSPGMSPLKHLAQGRSIMFGKGFENCRYEIPRVPGLELSGGDLRFRGPRGLRKLRHDSNGRPYIQARKVVGHESDRET